ncbi:MAG: hypothetical protein C4527_25605 [Candidatus Omnitrophota bacterium]|nr:MAG: hypothetical protein C4527_25605 [Candidatus Omnitrophota bacterium]
MRPLPGKELPLLCTSILSWDSVDRQSLGINLADEVNSSGVLLQWWEKTQQFREKSEDPWLTHQSELRGSYYFCKFKFSRICDG